MNEIFIFDIDGVITSPFIKKPNSFILSFIASQLNKNTPVALATGRAMAWIQARILPEIQENLKDNSYLDNLFISGEKGGVWMEFVNGVSKQNIDSSIHFPKEIAKSVYLSIQGKKGIFFDPDKYTMVSIEAVGGMNEDEISEQKIMLRDMSKLLQKNVLLKYPDIIIELSEISVDILLKDVNKRVAVNKFLSFLGKKKIQPSSFIVFGDSPSDVLIPEELVSHHENVTFMYVGKEQLPGKYNFPIKKTKSTCYDSAVMELLKSYVVK